MYLAHDATLARDVAIKVILPNLAESEADRAQLLARFWREARISAGLKHRNVVEILDFGEDANHHMPFLVMELLVGCDFETLIRRERRVGPRRAVHVLTQVCRAIGAAHRKKQIHRDLKPSNIFVLDNAEEPDFVKVVDFGLAREIPDPSSPAPAPALTATGAILGTVLYMAPEQVEAGRGDPIDHRCDIYALGCVAYHALAGRPPFVGQSVQAILVGHLTKVAEPLHQLVPELPRALSDVVAQALAKRPGHRPQTMTHLREAFERAMRSVSRTVSVPPVSADDAEPSASQPIAASAESSAPSVPTSEQTLSDPRDPPAPATAPTLLASATRQIRDAIGEVCSANPAMATLQGRIVLAYESDLSGSTQICARTLSPDLAQLDDFALLTSAPRSAFAPKVLAIEDQLLVAWVDTRSDDGGTSLYARIDSADRRPLVDERALTGRGLVADPAVCRLASGKVLVAWSELVPDPCVKATIVSADLQSMAPTRRLGSGSRPSVVAHGTGAIVAWHEVEDRIRVASLGTAEEIKLELPGAVFPVLTSLCDGGVALAYWSSGGEDREPTSYVTKLVPGGRLGIPLRIGAATRTPRPVALATAAHHLICVHFTPQSSAVHLNATAVDLGLTTVGGPIDLGPAKGTAADARLAVLAQGEHCVVAYSGASLRGLKVTEIRAARWTA